MRGMLFKVRSQRTAKYEVLYLRHSAELDNDNPCAYYRCMQHWNPRYISAPSGQLHKTGMALIIYGLLLAFFRWVLLLFNRLSQEKEAYSCRNNTSHFLLLKPVLFRFSFSFSFLVSKPETCAQVGQSAAILLSKRVCSIYYFAKLRPQHLNFMNMPTNTISYAN